MTLTITGGRDEDNNMEAFGDYFYTILHMKEFLLKEGGKPPFIIKTPQYLKKDAQINNHAMFLLMDYDCIELQGRTIEVKEGEKAKVYFNELDYILAQEYIKEWIIDESLYRDQEWTKNNIIPCPIIILTDGIKEVRTGALTVYGYNKYEDWEDMRGKQK